MPGDSGCSPSPCCGNIKRNRSPPSRYNCCRDLRKSLKSLSRNLCNPDCWYHACYFQSPCLDAASRDIRHVVCSALLVSLTYRVNIVKPPHTHTDQRIIANINTHLYRIHITCFIFTPLSKNTQHI